MAHRLALTAEADLDGIWLYVAKKSGSMKIADGLIDSITERFYLLSRYPHIGRRRDRDLRPGLRSFFAGEFVILYPDGSRRRAHSPRSEREPEHSGVAGRVVTHGGQRPARSNLFWNNSASRACRRAR